MDLDNDIGLFFLVVSNTPPQRGETGCRFGKLHKERSLTRLWENPCLARTAAGDTIQIHSSKNISPYEKSPACNHSADTGFKRICTFRGNRPQWVSRGPQDWYPSLPLTPPNKLGIVSTPASDAHQLVNMKTRLQLPVRSAQVTCIDVVGG